MKTGLLRFVKQMQGSPVIYPVGMCDESEDIDRTAYTFTIQLNRITKDKIKRLYRLVRQCNLRMHTYSEYDCTGGLIGQDVDIISIKGGKVEIKLVHRFDY